MLVMIVMTRWAPVRVAMTVQSFQWQKSTTVVQSTTQIYGESVIKAADVMMTSMVVGSVQRWWWRVVMILVVQLVQADDGRHHSDSDDDKSECLQQQK